MLDCSIVIIPNFFFIYFKLLHFWAFNSGKPVGVSMLREPVTAGDPLFLKKNKLNLPGCYLAHKNPF